MDAKNAKLDLISNVIRMTLNINCAVLMGANIAGEVALEHYCETTIGQSAVWHFVPLGAAKVSIYSICFGKSLRAE